MILSRLSCKDGRYNTLLKLSAIMAYSTLQFKSDGLGHASEQTTATSMMLIILGEYSYEMQKLTSVPNALSRNT